MNSRLVAILLLATAGTTPAYAYIGPGLGAGTIGVILGVIGSILLALFAVLWYPIKRLMKKKERKEVADAEESTTEAPPVQQEEKPE